MGVWSFHSFPEMNLQLPFDMGLLLSFIKTCFIPFYVLVETESLISVMISDDNWGNSSESDKTFSSNVFLLQKHDNKICAFLQYVDVVVPDHNDNNNNNLPSFDPMKQFGLCI